MNQNELKIINDTQNEYEDLLIKKIEDNNLLLKTINFSSPTGTGKTKMIADVIEKMSDQYFFIITTLSKGQLSRQIKHEIKRFTIKNNYCVYGLNDYTKNTILQADDILARIPENKTIIWFRDEGHIDTNRWMEILKPISNKIVNFSATNKYNSDDDINCNFTHTMMLRTVIQSEGGPEDAILKLLEVKKQHKNVSNYNPCAIFRILEENILEKTIKLCQKYNLKSINITDEAYDMSDICKDDNEYDVIINKFKVVEGVDIRRAHVLYMTNEPKNPATTIQVIGRCRRNALLYRNDIDILAPGNEELLKNTRICYCFFNVLEMHIDENDNGELLNTFCPIISVENLKANSKINLTNGKMTNGLEIFEAGGLSGTFVVKKDDETGFNVLSPSTFLYYPKFFQIKLTNSISKFYKIEDLKNIEFFLRKNDLYYHIKTPVRYNDFLEKALFSYKSFEQYKDGFLNYKICKTGYYIKTFSYNFSFKTGFHFSYSEHRSKYFETILEFRKNNEIQYQRLKEDIHSFFDYWQKNYAKNPIIKTKTVKIPALSILPKEAENLTLSFSSVSELKTFLSIPPEIRKISFILSGDTFKIVKNSNSKETNKYKWIEDTSVTGKINKYSKFNLYITKQYKIALEKSQNKFYHKKNIIFKTKKFNSMFGFCVEYTTKEFFKIELMKKMGFDEEYSKFITKNKLNGSDLFQNLIFKAFCVRKAIKEYQKNMRSIFNMPATRIPSVSFEVLIGEKKFVSQVVKYAERTFLFIKKYFEIKDENDYFLYNETMKKCDLSIPHNRGLADFIIDNTILDLKCTSSIDEKYIKQVLAYYWLSEKHQLNIQNVMLYDAIQDRWLKINMKTNEITSNYK